MSRSRRLHADAVGCGHIVPEASEPAAWAGPLKTMNKHNKALCLRSKMKENIVKMNNQTAVFSRPHSTGGWIRLLLQAVLDAHEKRAQNRAVNKAIRELSQLDDHILKDMGLSRSSIGEAVRERAENERRGHYGW